MASSGEFKFLVGDEFNRKLGIIMEKLPVLSDEEIALEMRELIRRGHSTQQVKQAKQMLQARPGIVQIVFGDGRYLIHDAVDRTSKGDPSWVADLLQHGADPNARSLKSGDTPIHWVCKMYKINSSAHLQALQYLVQAGADINFLNDKKPAAEGQTPLIVAVNTSYTWDEDKITPDEGDKQALEIVEACVQFGAKVNATDSSGRTALHWAVLSGNASIVKRLLDAGGDPELKDAKKRVMLDWWTHQRNKATLEVLEQRMDPKHFAKKQVVQPDDQEDSEVDSEDEVDRVRELKRYFPAVDEKRAAVEQKPSPSLRSPGSVTTISEEHDRLVKRMMWFGSRDGWRREMCLDALIKCDWDFNAATGYVCKCISDAREQKRMDDFDKLRTP